MGNRLFTTPGTVNIAPTTIVKEMLTATATEE